MPGKKSSPEKRQSRQSKLCHSRSNDLESRSLLREKKTCRASSGPEDQCGASPATPECEYVAWPHRPAHLFVPDAMYSLSAGTMRRQTFIDTPAKKSFLLETLFAYGLRFGWCFEAWAVLDNHYHFVAQAPEDAGSLRRLLQAVHSFSAREFNRLDGTPGRRVWYQYWDTCITGERSYRARLKYVHENPEKHGVINDAAAYPWCSMWWFLETDDADADRILGTATDRVTLYDDF